MLLINYIFATSAALAFTDYFLNVDVLKKKLNNGEISEDREVKDTKKITKSDEIQVFSLAVHGNRTESSTEVFSKMLYDKVVETRKKSALYNFFSNINSVQSGDYYTGRCIPTHCCKEIINRNVGKANENYNETTCKSFKIKRKLREELNKKLELNNGVCKFKEVCYLNAGHVTSENFTTTDLKELLPERYPVSFHGFQDKKDSPVRVVLGGLSRQKYELAEAYHNATKGSITIAICRSGNNCRIYNPNKRFEERIKVDGSGLSGSSEDNFVNLGIHKCGLQLELSTTFRDSKKTARDYWRVLVNEIFNTLPKKINGESQEKGKKRICDDEKLYNRTSTDIED